MSNSENFWIGVWQKIGSHFTALALLAGVFWAGMLLQGRMDDSYEKHLRATIEHLQNRLSDTLGVKDYVANIDIAQMSPNGAYCAVSGSATFCENQSELIDSVKSVTNAIRRHNADRALSVLNWIAKEYPSFPYTSYYRGLVEIRNVESRAQVNFQDAHKDFVRLLSVKPYNSSMRLVDAITLTYLGYGDSATIQLFNVCKYNPSWSQFSCESFLITYDSASLGSDERRAWSEFDKGLRNLKCDTVRLSSGVATFDTKSPIPKIRWPERYR